MPYTRIFIPLSCEAQGFAYKGRTPSGRALLETGKTTTEGKLSLWVQDLQPETLYRAVLVFENEGAFTEVILGTVPVGSGGQGEARLSLDLDSLGPLSNLSAIAVTAKSQGEQTVPLCGYITAEKPSRHGIFPKAAATPPTTQPAPAAPDIPAEPPEPPKAPLTSDAPAPVAPIAPVLDLSPDQYPRVYPFERQRRDVRWFRITPDGMPPLPAPFQTLLNSPFVAEAFETYDHLLLGKTVDGSPERCYIGIPDFYEENKIAPGFKRFKCCADKPPTPGEYGYWLLYV